MTRKEQIKSAYKRTGGHASLPGIAECGYHLSGLLGEYDGVSAGAFQGFTKKQKSPWWKEWGVFAAGNDTLDVN